MSRDAFPRFFFFDSDEPEQRHRVLIEFGLCAGVGFGDRPPPVEGVPVHFRFVLVGTFLASLLDWGFFAGLGFSLMLSTDPTHKLQLLAAGQSVCNARVPPSIIHARTLSIVAYRLFARVSLFRLSREVPRAPNSRPTLTNTHSAGDIANGVGRCPSYLTGTLNVRYDTVGLAAPWQMARSGRGMGIPSCMFPASPPVGLLHLPRNGSLSTGVQRQWCYNGPRLLARFMPGPGHLPAARTQIQKPSNRLQQ